MDEKPKPVEVYLPQLRMFAILACSAAFFAFSVFRTSSASTSGRDQFYGPVGIVVFGLALIVVIWRMISTQGPVLTLSDTGIRDVRILENEVPWTAVRNVREWRDGDGFKYLVLDVDPGALPGIRMTRVARTVNYPFVPVSEDGVIFAAAWLPIDFETLLQEATRRMNLARSARD